MVRDNLDFPNIPWSNVPKQVVFFNWFNEVYHVTISYDVYFFFRMNCFKAYNGEAFLRFFCGKFEMLR